MAQNTCKSSCIIVMREGFKTFPHWNTKLAFVAQCQIKLISHLSCKNLLLKFYFKWAEIDLKCDISNEQSYRERPSSTSLITKLLQQCRWDTTAIFPPQTQPPKEDRRTWFVCGIEKDWGRIFIVEKEVWGDRHNSTIFWRPGKDLLPRGRTGSRITTKLFVQFGARHLPKHC